jgi:hypothetical protein
MGYPKDVYHKELGKKTIFSEAEEHEDWLDNPGMFLPEDHFEYVPPVLKKLSVKEAEQIADQVSESLDHELGKVKPSKKKSK